MGYGGINFPENCVDFGNCYFEFFRQMPFITVVDLNHHTEIFIAQHAFDQIRVVGWLPAR